MGCSRSHAAARRRSRARAGRAHRSGPPSPPACARGDRSARRLADASVVDSTLDSIDPTGPVRPAHRPRPRARFISPQLRPRRRPKRTGTCSPPATNTGQGRGLVASCANHAYVQAHWRGHSSWQTTRPARGSGAERRIAKATTVDGSSSVGRSSARDRQEIGSRSRVSLHWSCGRSLGTRRRSAEP
jgi:hypothetical protein